MTETIQTAMDRLMTISAEPQDYIAGDGLLYCGTCNTPKAEFRTEREQHTAGTHWKVLSVGQLKMQRNFRQAAEKSHGKFHTLMR